MTNVIRPPQQANAWVRGLLSVAWADGHYDAEEREIIESFAREKWGEVPDGGACDPLDGEQLAALAADPSEANEFLRMALMVAMADGVYSEAEDRLLRTYCTALGNCNEALAALRTALQTPQAEGGQCNFDVLAPVRLWIDRLEVDDPKFARFICRLIPAQCPFERDVVLFGRKVAHIPPMCKLNPVYDQLVGLRFRALSYLADECGEDVTPYL